MANGKKPLEAFIFVKAVQGRTKDVVSLLAAGKKTFAIKGIKEVFRTTGEWDAVAVVEADDLQGIYDISDKISKFKGPDQLVSGTSVTPCGHKNVGDP